MFSRSLSGVLYAFLTIAAERFRSMAQVEIVGAANKENIDRMADLGANCASIQGPANFGISAFYGAGATAMTAWEGKNWRKLVNPPKILEELVEFKEVQALLLKNRRMLGDDEIRAVAVRIRQTA
jgi:hypothetical protein